MDSVSTLILVISLIVIMTGMGLSLTFADFKRVLEFPKAIFVGFLNIYIAQNFNEDTWVNFKLFGMTALLFLYIISITIYIAKVNKG